MRLVAVGAHCFSQVLAWVWMFWLRSGGIRRVTRLGVGFFVGDFPVGCGVGLQAFGEQLSERF